jgi:PIN domain nuclease of toxin-antitoxin system
MRLLLDTHMVLWTLTGSARLPRAARRLLGDPDNECFVSAASTWEIAIRSGLGKSPLSLAPADLEAAIVDAGLRPLPITLMHSLAIEAVQLPHSDPFDRLLLAQCHVETLRLLTVDRMLLGSPLALAAH